MATKSNILEQVASNLYKGEDKVVAEASTSSAPRRATCTTSARTW
jgi:hypothetical protein